MKEVHGESTPDNNGIADPPSRNAPTRRYFGALHPSIVIFQEFQEWSPLSLSLINEVILIVAEMSRLARHPTPMPERARPVDSDNAPRVTQPGPS